MNAWQSQGVEGISESGYPFPKTAISSNLPNPVKVLTTISTTQLCEEF